MSSSLRQTLQNRHDVSLKCGEGEAVSRFGLRFSHILYLL